MICPLHLFCIKRKYAEEKKKYEKKAHNGEFKNSDMGTHQPAVLLYYRLMYKYTAVVIHSISIIYYVCYLCKKKIILIQQVCLHSIYFGVYECLSSFI